MRKLQTLLSAALLLTAGLCVAPAQADDAATMAKNVAWFPVQVLGVSTAWVVGTPICMVRRSCVRVHDLTVQMADQIGGHDHFPPVLLSSLISVPAGTIAGVGEGAYYGGRNAISHGVEHPFCLESFSLGGDVEK